MMKDVAASEAARRLEVGNGGAAEPSSEIQRYVGAALDSVRATLTSVATWTDLPEDERRRRAARAAQERDAATLWDLTRAVLALNADRAAAISPHTLRAYRKGVLEVLHDLEAENILNPKRSWASGYRARLSARLKPASVNVRLAAARVMYSALRWAGALSADPFEDVKGVRDPTKPWEKRNAYSEQDLAKLLEVADPRERLILLLGAHTGLRASEIAGLKRSDVDLRARRVSVVGKGGKRRMVKLSSTLTAAVVAFAPKHAKPTLLGVGASRLWQILDALLTRTGLTRSEGSASGVHSLRHSSGTRLYRESRDLMLVRDHLGHASVTTSERYAKSDERLEAVVGEW
jgi:integrase/recombinase XerC